ncbi:MAG: 50S ribosomal protein L11 methyltransferase [Clostridia bacterium]|nr:50S ribosomal protein L11 methyltransferase [Clostridia bacterium]
MFWIEAVVHTTTQGIDSVSGLLLMNGITGYAVQDSEDFNEFLEGKDVYFDYIEDDLLKLKECETTITFYVAENSQGLETLLAVKKAMDKLKLEDKDGKLGSLDVTTDKKIEEQDWENNWKKYFKPFSVGENLCIKPSWEELPEQFKKKTVIEIDPSSSFGTGSHTTTRLCLEMVEKYMAAMSDKPVQVLDMGCGSGILGIAAHLLGAKHITAVDIDENSARIAKENFAENNIAADKYDVLAGNILNDVDFYNKVCSKKYDLIAANIVADVLIWMAPVFKKVLNENGYLLVSGIISERSDEVVSALEENGLLVKEFCESQGWAAVVLCHASL